ARGTTSADARGPPAHPGPAPRPSALTKSLPDAWMSAMLGTASKGTAVNTASGTETMAETNGPESHDPCAMLRAALRGFHGARQRLATASLPGAPPEYVFAPLAEALWWTVSVNDGFEELADNGRTNAWPSKQHYQDARDKDPSGRVLVGLRYARDRCGH